MRTKTYRLISAPMLLLLALLFVGAKTITAAPGDLDPTFGIGGRINPSLVGADIADIVVQPDQKILISGTHFNNSTGEYGLLVSRYLPNGTLDPTFGVGGQIIQGNGGGGGKLALQADGKILVAAGAILRYLTDGNLDTTFDGDGALPFRAFSVNALAVQNDGKIILAGTNFTTWNHGDPSFFGLARLNSDGSFDATFGSNGIATTEFFTSSYLREIVIQGDGKIVAAGTTFNSPNALSHSIALSRYNVDGSLDMSFGTSGRVVTRGAVATDGSVDGSDVALQADNKIVVAGYYGDGGLVIRFMPDGLPDASFGDAGQVSIPNLYPSNIAVQSNGKIVVGGGTTHYNNSSHALGRLLSNGELDPTFGTNGRVTTTFPNLGGGVIDGRIERMAIQRDGKIVTVGYWSGQDGDGNWYWGYATIARYIGDQTPTLTCPNPIDCAEFFVLQHYRDFLGREAESIGLADWQRVLSNCSSGDLECFHQARLTVSAAFFGSPEFQLKGYFAFRFYRAAFNRLPLYDEIIADMQILNGQSPAEVYAKRAAFTNSFAQGAEFLNRFSALSNADYVAALLNQYGLTSVRTAEPLQPEDSNKITLSQPELVARLDAGLLTRAQVLRAIADSDEVFQIEFNRAFVAMQYYGYLRRTPEPDGYDAWLDYLNAHPTDFREMVRGFVDSIEYRRRFGTP